MCVLKKLSKWSATSWLAKFELRNAFRNSKLITPMDTKHPLYALLHNFFEITILIKGISGLLEIMFGFLFIFLDRQTIYNLLIGASHRKVISHSGHFAADYLVRQANNFSLNTKYFIAFYFLFYGAMNLFLIISLLRGKMWAYPAAMVFFVIFIVYQFYRFFMRHSGLLLFFAIFDIFLVALTWFEYERVKKLKNA